jgi:hypothetical protein
MPTTHLVFHWLAATGAIVNAFLFVPQIVKIVRIRRADGVSTTMYVGFLVLQVVTGVDLVFHQLWGLAAGMAASAVATSTIIVLALRYQPVAAHATARSG